MICIIVDYAGLYIGVYCETLGIAQHHLLSESQSNAPEVNYISFSYAFGHSHGEEVQGIIFILCTMYVLLRRLSWVEIILLLGELKYFSAVLLFASIRNHDLERDIMQMYYKSKRRECSKFQVASLRNKN